MRIVLETTQDPPRLAIEEVAATPGGGGGGGGGSAGGVTDIDPVPTSVVGGPLSANFVVSASSVLEGEARELEIRLNQTLSTPAVVDVALGSGTTAPSGAVTLSTNRVVFPIGVTTQTLTVSTTSVAGGSGGSIAVIELIQTPIGAEPGALEVIPRSSEGSIGVQLAIEDVTTGGGARWSFGAPGGVATAFEASGPIEYIVQLDRPAEQVEQVTVSAGFGSTATEGVDYDPFQTVVSIPVGESSGSFFVTYPDNAPPSPAQNPVLEIVGSAATALPGAVTIIAVTILDNDDGGAGSGTVRIDWTEAAISMNEGGARTLTARLTVNGTAQGFSSALTVPILTAGDTDQFILRFGSGPPDAVFFAAGASTATIIVDSVDDGVPGAITVEFDLTGSGLPINLQTGPVFRTSITSTLVTSEVTTLHVPAMQGGARRMIQTLVAVAPPSASLPEYKLSTGERVQVVGHTRDAEGRWVAAYVYGLAPATESLAGTPGALELRPANSSDPAPVEAGDFPAAPILTFRLGQSQVGERVTNTAAFAGSTGSVPTSTREWTGPNGRWDQTGPEIVSQKEYLMRPMNPSVTQSLNMKSPDTLGYIELCETRIAGDPNVILYEGQWVNGAWASQAQIDVDAFAENPYCDGEVALGSIEARVFTGSFGNNGWSLKFIDAHPAQVTLSPERLLLLRGRAEPYFFPTCQAYTFRFVAVRDVAEPDALLRATDYHRYKNVAWAVGGLGSTRNRIYGDTADLTVDWARAGLQDNGIGGSAQGWRAVKELGEDYALGYQTQGGCIDDWTTGGTFPWSQSSEQREGWHHPIYPDGGGRSSGRGIYGSAGHVPWWGYWYAASMRLHKIACRVRHQYRDVTNGATPWWWQLAETVGGEPRIAVGGSFGQGTAKNRHWHLTGTIDTDEKIGSGQTPVDQLRLAPTTRPWNATTGDDPQHDRIKRFETFHETHMPRERTVHTDSWWGMRSYLGFKSYEGRASSLTRSHPPILQYGLSQNDFETLESNFAELLLGQAENPARLHLGMQVSRSQAYITADFLRAWGWVMIVSTGFYSIADTTDRTALRGGGLAASYGGADWFASLAGILEFVCEATGLVGRGYAVAGPDPYDRTAFGEPDYCGKTGAIPKAEFVEGQPCRPLPSGELTLPFALGFHQIFCVRGVDVMRRRVFDVAGDENRDFLLRALEWHGKWIEGARAFTTVDGTRLIPHGIIAAIDTDGGSHTVLSGPLPAASTIEDLTSGDLFWYFNKITPGSMGPVAWINHNSKAGWTSVAGYIGLGDPAQLDLVKSVYSRSGASDASEVANLMGGASGINTSLTTGSSSKRISELGEQSFLLPYLSELLNRIS